MINSILKFHSDLEKGQQVKIIAVDDYTTYINRTDLLKKETDNIVWVLRANGGKIAINTDYIISCCTIERL